MLDVGAGERQGERRADRDDHDLIAWLVMLAEQDRAQYRVIREVAWAMRVARSRCSEIPSNLS